jgi:hypothetical protein
VRLDDADEPFAGHHADAPAHLRGHRHDRNREDRRPQLRVAELRPRLRVGGDRRRIIVRCAGDKPRTELREEIFEWSHAVSTIRDRIANPPRLA